MQKIRMEDTALDIAEVRKKLIIQVDIESNRSIAFNRSRWKNSVLQAVNQENTSLSLLHVLLISMALGIERMYAS